MSRFEPVNPELLARRLADLIDRRHPGDRPLRIAVDAPACADLAGPIAQLGAELLRRGRPSAVVTADGFYRDASLRLEYGHTDVESFYSGWLDIGALQREVLDPVAVGGQYLPSLRDRQTNRATRAEPRHLPGHGVLILTGELLIGIGLHLDVSVHVAVSRQARKRLVPEARQWTLPAYDRYDLEVDPAGLVDAVIRYDDPRHPALLIR